MDGETSTSGIVVASKTMIPVMSMTIGKLALALSKAQSTMSGAAKGAENPFFKSKYADLASVWDAARDHLAKNELSVIQLVEGDVTNMEIVTMLCHSSGEWIRGTLKLKPTKADPQGFGSACTYGRRYGLAAIVGLAQVDDDGNAASAPAPAVKIAKKVKEAVYNQSVACLAEGDETGLKEIWSEHEADEKVVLWAMFNSQQRSSMKKLLSGE